MGEDGGNGKTGVSESENIALQTEGQAQEVAWLQVVCDGTDEVEVAGADFVVERETFVVLPFLLGNVELNALANGKVDAQTGGEAVVAGRVAVGLLCPELIVEDGVEIEAARERVDVDHLVQRFVPRDVVLLHGEGGLRFVRRIARNEAQEHFGFPLILTPIVPSHSEVQQAHSAGILQFGVGGDDAVPCPLVAHHAAVVCAAFRGSHRGGEAQDEENQQALNN